MWGKKIFEKLTIEMFSNLMKTHSLIDLNNSVNQRWMNTTKLTPWHVVVNLLKIKNKEKILEMAKQTKKQKNKPTITIGKQKYE